MSEAEDIRDTVLNAAHRAACRADAAAASKDYDAALQAHREVLRVHA